MTNGVTVRILGDDSDLRNKLNDSATQIVKWGAAAASAAAVGAVVLTKATAASAREIKNLSRLIGINTTEFQKMAAGAKTVGIEQDKLADIFKDVSDKVGDFIQTGAGPLDDFFTNIAPKVGVTADEFAKLSGPQALEKYVASLEAANVSQNEMTFFMEAIASDASLLTPLLKNNAEQFKALGNEAENTGAVLSQIEIEQLEALNREADKADLTFQSMANRISVELSPMLVAASKEMDNFINGAGGLEDVVGASMNGIVEAVGFVGNAFRGVEITVKGLEVGVWGVSAAALALGANFSDSLEAAATVANIAFESVKGDLDELTSAPLPSDSLKKWVAEAEAASVKVAELKVAAINTVDVPADEDPEILAARARFALLLEDQEAFELASSGKAAEYKDGELQTLAQFNAAILSLEQQQAMNRLSIAGDMFGNLSTLMSTENERLFEIGKIAAISGAVVNGYSAAVASYEKGAQVGGPVLGAAFAATSVLATGVQIANLSSTSFGSKSKPSAVGGGTPSTPASAPQEAAPQEQRRTVSIESLDPSSLFTGQSLTNLATELVNFQNDGFQLVV